MTNKHRTREPHKEVRNLNAILEVSKALGREVQLDNLLPIIIHKTTEVMDAERSSLFIYDDQTDELWSEVAEGLERKEIRFPLGVGIAGDVAKTRQVANIADAYQDPRFNPEFDKRTHFRTGSVLCTPMISNEGRLIGVIQVLNRKDGKVFDSKNEDLLEALASHAAVAIERAQLIEEHVEKQKIEESLKLAHDIQMGILPKTFPPYPNRSEFEIFASIEPAKEVGGDFYDFFLLDNDQLCFLIGDVSGKGIPAALFMAVTKTLFKATSTTGPALDQVMYRVNNELCQENESGMFVTIFAGTMNLRTGQVYYCNGGHNPPYLLRSDGRLESLELTAGIALGVLEDSEYRMKTINLGHDDGIYLYTDGVNEAMDKDDNEFSYPRLEKYLTGLQGSSAERVTLGSMEAVNRFSQGAIQSDDITVMTIKYFSS